MFKHQQWKLNDAKEIIERGSEILDSMSNRDTEVNEQYNESFCHDEIPSCEEPPIDYDKLEFVKAINLSPTHIEKVGTDEIVGDSFKSCLKTVDSESSSQGIVGERVHFASPIAVHYDYSQPQSTPSTQTLDLVDSQSSEQIEENMLWNEEVIHNTADEKLGAETSVEELLLEDSSPVESIEHSPSNLASSVNDINTLILDQQDIINCSLLETMKSTGFNNNDNNTEENSMAHSDKGKLSGRAGAEVKSEDYLKSTITITRSIIESVLEKCVQSAEGRNSSFVLDNFITRTKDGVETENEIQSLIKTGHTDKSFKSGQRDRYADFRIGNSSQINVNKEDMNNTEVVSLSDPSGQGINSDTLDNNADVTTNCNRQQIIRSEDEDSGDTDACSSSQQHISSDLNNSESTNTFNSQQRTVSSEKVCRSEDIKIHNPQEQNEEIQDQEDLYLPSAHNGAKTHTFYISVPTNEDRVICKMTKEKSLLDPQLSYYHRDVDACEKQKEDQEECKEHKSDDFKDCHNDSRGNLQMDHSWSSMDDTEICPHTKSFVNKSRNHEHNLEVSLEVTDIIPGKNLDGKAENHNCDHAENVQERPEFNGISVYSFKEQLKFSIPKYSLPHDDEIEIIPYLTNGGKFIQSQDAEMFNKSQTPRHLLKVTTEDCDVINLSENNCESLNAVAKAECISETNQLSAGSKAVAEDDMRDIKPGIAESISLKEQKLCNSYQRSITDHDTTLVGHLWNIGGLKSNNDHTDDSVVPQIVSHYKRHISKTEDTADWSEKRMKLENVLYSTNLHGQILLPDDLMDENQISLLHKSQTNPSVPMPLENYETTLPKFHIAEVSMESSGGELSIQSLMDTPGFISAKDYQSSQESVGSSHGFSIHLSQEEQLELSPQTMNLESSEMVEKIKDQAVPVDLDVGDHVHLDDSVDSRVEPEPVLFYEDQPEKAYKSQEGCFKWKYTPSSNLDEILPSECDNNQEDIMTSIRSLATCARPFRVGLSKRQRVDHLHRSPRK